MFCYECYVMVFLRKQAQDAHLSSLQKHKETFFMGQQYILLSKVLKQVFELIQVHFVNQEIDLSLIS